VQYVDVLSKWKNGQNEAGIPMKMNKMQRKTLNNGLKLLMLSLSIGAHGMASAQDKDVKTLTRTLAEKVPELLKNNMVPGAAVAIIQNGQVVFKQGYGLADVAQNKKVDIHTGFNIGSISKTVAAWGVMKLVEQGKLSLDAPIEKYLTRWHLPKTEFDAKGVTVRRLLSHTAGLSLHGYPGWGPKDKLPSIEASLSGTNNGPGKVSLIMEPGTKWKYSGGGYTISQLLIEEVSGQSFEDYMREHVLRPLGMYGSDYSLTAKVLAASATAYDNWAEVTPNPRFTAKAAAGLHTTIADFGKFVAAAVKGAKGELPGRSVISMKTVNQMMTPVAASEGRWGLGYDVVKLPGDFVANGHGGANRGWHANFKVIPKTGDGIVVTTNGSNGQYIYRNVFCRWTQWVTSVKDDKGCESGKSIRLEMIHALKSGGIEAAIKQYHLLKKTKPTEYSFSDSQLNNLGYSLLHKHKMDEAIAMFKLNVEAYPLKPNSHDSLGEAYMLNGEKAKAIKSYQQVLVLDPKNTYAQEMLEKLAAMK
jgi:CubicO group peptidase (beta-lactamase class C family)